MLFKALQHGRQATALPTATNNGAGFGIVTAAMNAAGYTPGGATTNCQTFNGTSWTEVGNTTEAASSLWA